MLTSSERIYHIGELVQSEAVGREAKVITKVVRVDTADVVLENAATDDILAERVLLAVHLLVGGPVGVQVGVERHTGTHEGQSNR